MDNRNEQDAKRDEFRRQLKESEKNARDFCQEYTIRVHQNIFDISSFLEALGSLDKKAFKFAVEFLIREKKEFWGNLTATDLKSIIEHIIGSSWFQEDHPSSTLSQQDLFEVVFLNASGISIIVDLYKSTAKSQKKAARYLATKLASTENGRSTLVEILKIDDAEIQNSALYALTEHCVRSGIYPIRVSDDIHLYLDTIRSFVFNSNGKLSGTATMALHRGGLLNTEEVIKLMQIGGPQRNVVGINSLKYLKVDSSKSKELCALVVKALEDKNIEISNAALEGIANLSERFSDLLVEEILDGLVIRKLDYPKEFFNTNIIISALREVFKHNPRLPGGTLHKLCEIAYTSSSEVRNRAVFVAIALNKKEFLALVNERRQNNPSAAKSILNTVTGTLDTDQIANQISQTDPKDVQQNAANQITVLAKYYENGLLQAKTSFNWAITITIFSIMSFIVAVLLFVNNTDKTGTVIAAVGGALTQLVAGTLLLIYRQTLSQLDNYTQQMSKVQNYLLANSFVESLEGEAKAQARIELIRTVADGANPQKQFGA